MAYDETIKKWDEHAGEIAAIHPAGAHSESAFWDSGYEAAKVINDTVVGLGLNPAELSIVDYGCGVGRVSLPLTSLFKEVYAHDSSTQMIEALNDNVDGHENLFYCGCGNEGCLPVEKDVATSISVFIHHTYEDGVKMLKEVAGMVKENGLLLLQIPIYDVGNPPDSWTGVGVWSREQFSDAVKEAGLWIVEMWSSPGAFSYNEVGVNHHKLQILRK